MVVLGDWLVRFMSFAASRYPQERTRIPCLQAYYTLQMSAVILTFSFPLLYLSYISFSFSVCVHTFCRKPAKNSKTRYKIDAKIPETNVTYRSFFFFFFLSLFYLQCRIRYSNTAERCHQKAIQTFPKCHSRQTSLQGV